jgi:hypothetical protein
VACGLELKVRNFSFPTTAIEKLIDVQNLTSIIYGQGKGKEEGMWWERKELTS